MGVPCVSTRPNPRAETAAVEVAVAAEEEVVEDMMVAEVATVVVVSVHLRSRHVLWFLCYLMVPFRVQVVDTAAVEATAVVEVRFLETLFLFVSPNGMDG